MNRTDIQGQMYNAVVACLEFMRTLHETVSSPAVATATKKDGSNLSACGSHCSLLADAYFSLVGDLPEPIQVSEEVRNYWPRGYKKPESVLTPVNCSRHYLRPLEVIPPLQAEDLPKKEEKVQKLLQQGCFRGAANILAWMLFSQGYGIGGREIVGTHTPLAIRYWLTRFALLISEQEYCILHYEWEQFDQDPDMYDKDSDNENDQEEDGGIEKPVGYNPCFCFRLIIAKMPLYFKPKENTPKRLFDLFNHCQAIHEHFTAIDEVSAEFWYKRKIRVGYAIASYAINLRKFELLNQVNTALIANCQSYDEEKRTELFHTWATLHQYLMSLGRKWFTSPSFGPSLG